jgi:signal transduction histidine kinase
MLDWLHRHYVVVWLIAFVVIFVILGGWLPIMRWREILFGELTARNRGNLQMVAALTVLSFIGACIFCGIIGFTYMEDPSYHSIKEGNEPLPYGNQQRSAPGI